MSLDLPVTGGRSLTSSGTGHGGQHQLVRRIGVPDHQGAQQLMAGDHVVERALQHRDIHRAGDAQRADHHEPEAERPAVVALVERENHSWVKDSGYRFDSWSSASEDSVIAASPLPWLLPRVSHEVEPAVDVTGRGRLEQVGHRYPDTEGGADAPGQHHCLYRAAAEVEEVVVDAAPGHPQYLGEQLAQDFLAGRGSAPGTAAGRSGQAPAARRHRPFPPPSPGSRRRPRSPLACCRYAASSWRKHAAQARPDRGRTARRRRSGTGRPGRRRARSTATSASPGKAARADLTSPMPSEFINGSPSICGCCTNYRTGWLPATPSRSQGGKVTAPS